MHHLFTPLWTASGARLSVQSHASKDASDKNLNWLFLPGGPGLGSESLAELTQALKNRIPGTIWHLDLPNDGSNRLENKPFSQWQQALLEAASCLPNVIIAGHSTGGMYIQATSEIEEKLVGLVLMDTAPDHTWIDSFVPVAAQNKDAAIALAEKQYEEAQNDENLRNLTVASAKLCFTQQKLEEGKKMLAGLPINDASMLWSQAHFDTSYVASWIPKKIPTVILGGAYDQIIPLSVYTSKESYQRDNISFQEISGGSHFPWFENPEEVVQSFMRLMKYN